MYCAMVRIIIYMVSTAQQDAHFSLGSSDPGPVESSQSQTTHLI